VFTSARAGSTWSELGFLDRRPGPTPRCRQGGPGGLQKGGFARRVRDVVREHPEAEVQVWAEDEGRFGLIPSCRRIWAPKGKRPTMSSRRRYEWRYLFSFVRPQTGETINIIGSTVSAAIMSAVLQEFADDAGLGAKRRAVLVLDGAGWHVAKDLRVPEGIHLVFLPPYSPELQPAERLWPIVNEAVANRGFHTIGDLEKAVERRCLYMDAHKAYVKSLTCYHWWPQEPSCEG
jgi:transposase